MNRNQWPFAERLGSMPSELFFDTLEEADELSQIERAYGGTDARTGNLRDNILGLLLLNAILTPAVKEDRVGITDPEVCPNCGSADCPALKLYQALGVRRPIADPIIKGPFSGFSEPIKEDPYRPWSNDPMGDMLYAADFSAKTGVPVEHLLNQAPYDDFFWMRALEAKSSPIKGRSHGERRGHRRGKNKQRQQKARAH